MTIPSVGTNRFAYANNNPVNLSDPGGNCPVCIAVIAVGAWLGSNKPANAPGPDDQIVHQSERETIVNTLGGAALGVGVVAVGTEAAGACAINSTCRTAVIGAGAADTTANIVGCIDGDPLSCAAMATPGGARATDNVGNGQTGVSGNRGNPIENPGYLPIRNTSTTIGDRTYSGHALDQMQNRGIPPSVIENTLSPRNFQGSGNRPGTSVYYDPTNGVRVITNDKGDVVTVIWAEKQ